LRTENVDGDDHRNFRNGRRFYPCVLDYAKEQIQEELNLKGPILQREMPRVVSICKTSCVQ